MIITVLSLGGVLLGATTLAGLLIVFELRQNTDFANSTRAIYAADAGIEWAAYQVKTGTAAPPLVFSNGASVAVTCYDAAGVAESDCTSTSTAQVRSIGKAVRSARALQLSF